MTGYTENVQHFDNWIVNNYTGLQKYCKKYRIEEDLLDDTYLNVRERIARSGFTETYYKTYMLRALRNLQINENKKLKDKHFVDYHNTDYTNTIESQLQLQDDIEKDTQIYREDILYLSKMIFKFIMNEKNYCDEYQFVFRCYYLMNGRMTYSKLTTMTGIDKSKCTRIIQTIKNDLRNEFLNWLKNEQRRNNRNDE